MATTTFTKAPGKQKAVYAAPKLTTYGNISELTGGPSAGSSDGASPGSMGVMT